MAQPRGRRGAGRRLEPVEPVELIEPNERRALVAQAPDQRLDGVGRAGGPGVEQHDRPVAVAGRAPGEQPGHQLGGDRVAGLGRRPVLRFDVPGHVAVPGRGDRGQDSRVLAAGAERAPEPRLRIHAGRVDDDPLGLGDVGAQALRREERHADVVEAMVADHVPGGGHVASARRVRLHPAALQEERGSHVEPGERLEEARLGRGVGRSIGVLGVERQGDAKRRGSRRRTRRATRRGAKPRRHATCRSR